MALKTCVALAALAALGLCIASGSDAQPSPSGPQAAETMAPVDMTGYWVSLITEDWRWRMVTPGRGDYASVPLNDDAYHIALAWDPAKDQAAGEQCKAYGAAGLMQLPEHLHITWRDPNALEVQTDTGMQTRLFHFEPWTPPAPASPSWQGDSVAKWEIDHGHYGSMRVVTTDLRPGYLRRNGVPYSAQTQLTEYWSVVRERNGTPLLIVTSVVHDPMYLQDDWITALQFKKEPDGAGWDPAPCSASE